MGGSQAQAGQEHSKARGSRVQGCASAGRLEEAVCLPRHHTTAQRPRGDLPERLVTFPAGFFIDFDCGKPAGKVANSDCVTAGCYSCYES